MTRGTAIVARTNVRTTGDMVASQSPSARLRAVNVGKTQSQIIAASWWRPGPGVAAGGFWVLVMESPGRRSRSGRRHGGGAGDVLPDELGVDGDGDGRAFAGGGDHLGPGVGGVARRPDA